MDELVNDESHYVPKREAEELFLVPDAVQIFFVRPDGRVTTFSEPTTTIFGSVTLISCSSSPYADCSSAMLWISEVIF